MDNAPDNARGRPLEDRHGNAPVTAALLADMVAAGRITDPATPRGRLLRAAARLFRQKGYARTTVRDLAAEIGILSGSIFHHFPNKEAILFAVMAEVVVAMTAGLKLRLETAAPTSRAQLRALIHNELAFIHGEEAGDATAVLVHEWRSLSEPLQRDIMSMRAAYEAYWLNIFQAASDEGHLVGEPAIVRQLLHGGLTWTVYWYRPDGRVDLDALTNQALAMVYRDGPG
ncbi:MAG: TetR/AcrR family transcriptional regulator [Gammaproteobacteria bacterium]|nr:TetR/AcrR family transcriptional regulator [Gammaproteobacteria bacterium]